MPQEELKNGNYQFNYKLAGQSCKIDLFAQLLKEFVPGRYLRGKGEADGESQLKLDCLEGSIRYIRDKEAGLFQPEICQHTPKLLYDLVLSDQNARTEKILLHGDEINIHVAPITAKWLHFSVRKAQEPDAVVNKFRFDLQKGMAEKNKKDEKTLEKLIKEKTYGVYKGKTETLFNKLFEEESKSKNEYVVFGLPASDGYGIYLFQIRVLQSAPKEVIKFYLQQEPKYYSFESDKMMTFFDGKR